MLKHVLTAIGVAAGLVIIPGTATGAVTPTITAGPAFADEPGWCTEPAIIRSGPHVGDTPYGQCNPGDKTTAHCWIEGDGPQPTWTLMTDDTTGIGGYVNNAFYTVGNNLLGRC